MSIERLKPIRTPPYSEIVCLFFSDNAYVQLPGMICLSLLAKIAAFRPKFVASGLTGLGVVSKALQMWLDDVGTHISHSFRYRNGHSEASNFLSLIFAAFSC